MDEGIRIVGQARPPIDLTQGTIRVFLELSDVPKADWVAVFKEVWTGRLPMGESVECEIEHTTLSLIAPVTEVLEVLPALESAVQDANAVHVARLSEKKAREHAAEVRQSQRDELIHQVSDAIDKHFRDGRS